MFSSWKARGCCLKRHRGLGSLRAWLPHAREHMQLHNPAGRGRAVGQTPSLLLRGTRPQLHPRMPGSHQRPPPPGAAISNPQNGGLQACFQGRKRVRVFRVNQAAGPRMWPRAALGRVGRAAPTPGPSSQAGCLPRVTGRASEAEGRRSGSQRCFASSPRCPATTCGCLYRTSSPSRRKGLFCSGKSPMSFPVPEEGGVPEAGWGRGQQGGKGILDCLSSRWSPLGLPLLTRGVASA